MAGPQEFSRRRMLTIAAGAAGTSIGAAMIVGTSTPASAAKVSQQVVKYQDMPKGEQHCENCLHFQPPSSCQSVDGTVSPQGWCMIYAKKPT
jgi:High potential iron-sulfur protein